jgi:hypothetical protein
VRRHTTAAATLTACAALLAGCGQVELGTVAASATVPAEPRTDTVRCREAEPRIASLDSALETLDLANASTFDSAHVLATSALTSWTETFGDAPDGPLAEAHEAGQRKLAHLERITSATSYSEQLEWTTATLEVVADAERYCTELTAGW